MLQIAEVYGEPDDRVEARIDSQTQGERRTALVEVGRQFGRRDSPDRGRRRAAERKDSAARWRRRCARQS